MRRRVRGGEWRGPSALWYGVSVRSPQRRILAVDAGGSTTRCVVVGEDGAVQGFGRGGPANHILSGWETARESLRQATAAALGGAGAGIDVAVVGSAGVGPNGEGHEIVESLLAELVPGAAVVRATGDMVTAFWGALSVPVGVVVSAGTGSVCFGRNAAGATCQVGGWGHIMGDEGSAYDIAVQALRAVARAADGRAAPTALAAGLGAVLGGDQALHLAARVYGEPLNRDQIAALAVAVAAVARDGDATAQDILRRAGEELGWAAAAALRTLGLLEVPVAVSFAGAVFEAGDMVRQPFAATIAAANARARVERPLLPPVGGAVRLAMAELGLRVEAAQVERLRAELATCRL